MPKLSSKVAYKDATAKGLPESGVRFHIGRSHLKGFFGVVHSFGMLSQMGMGGSAVGVVNRVAGIKAYSTCI